MRTTDFVWRSYSGVRNLRPADSISRKLTAFFFPRRYLDITVAQTFEIEGGYLGAALNVDHHIDKIIRSKIKQIIA